MELGILCELNKDSRVSLDEGDNGATDDEPRELVEFDNNCELWFDNRRSTSRTSKLDRCRPKTSYNQRVVDGTNNEQNSKVDFVEEVTTTNPEKWSHVTPHVRRCKHDQWALEGNNIHDEKHHA